MNGAWEGSRLGAPYANLMPGDLILHYDELCNHLNHLIHILQHNNNRNKVHSKCNALDLS